MSVLVVAAHPDDEVLGAGATIAKLADRGVPVHVLVLAEGVSLRRGWSLEQSRERCERAGAVMGVASLRFGGFGCERLLADGESRLVVAQVESALAELSPSMVLTHNGGDVHADHRVVSESVTYATRLMGMSSVRDVMHFEVPSSTEQQTSSSRAFRPTVFVDVGDYVSTKCAALEVYADECFDAPHPRSRHGVEATASWRGLHVGVAHAEAFEQSRRFVGMDHSELL